MDNGGLPPDGGDYYYSIGEKLVEANERPQRCFVGGAMGGVMVILVGLVGPQLLPISDGMYLIFPLSILAGIIIFLSSLVWCWIEDELEYWHRQYLGPR